MVLKYKWVKGRRYYYAGTYSSWNTALQKAKRERQLNNARWWIDVGERFFTGRKYYVLYLDQWGAKP